jgi:hypothetical protein
MQELRIPWPWVAFTLMLDVGLDVFTDLTGQTVPDRTFHAREIMVAPPLVLLPVPGESMEEQQERLTEAWRSSEAAGRAALAAASRGPRGGPKKKAGRRQDYGQWLYETEYRRPKRSRHALGRKLPVHLAHGHTAVCGCYKTISAGIQEARRLFALCAVTWDTLRPPAPPGPVRRRRRRTSSRATQREASVRQPTRPRGK